MNEHAPETSFFDQDYFFIRHGNAEYGLQKSILTWPDPRIHADISKQPEEDLVPGAEREIRLAAEDFLRHFNPEKDHFFFASSSLTRARQTAETYVEVGQNRWFTIITPHKAEGNNIRHVHLLWLPHIWEMLIEEIYKPENYLPMVQFWDKIWVHYREAWEECRRIIENDNRESWGANFLIHSGKVKEIFGRFAGQNPDEHFPRIFTAQDAKKRYTQGLEHLAQIMEKQRRQYNADHTGKICRVLAFWHENHMLPLMQENFWSDMVPNHVAALAMSIIDDAPHWIHK